MREIKFRAWNKNFEEMSMVADLDFWGGDVWIVDPDLEKLNQMDFSEVVLMQYTGLKDINGVEIYEGDIAIVKFTDAVGNSLMSHHIMKNPFDYDFKEVMWLYHAHEIEVIGNIFENADLIK